MSSILIVGANRGIGFALVEAIRAAQPDAVIYGTTRSASPELNALADKSDGHVVVLEGVDTTDAASLKKAAEQVSKHTSSLDIIYNNSGIGNAHGPIAQATPDDLRWHHETNVIGPHNVLVAFAPFVLASKAPRRAVVITSSAVGSIASLPAIVDMFKGFGADELTNGGYAVSKAAVNMLGRVWGEALEPKGVSVLLMHPGLVATRMAEKFPGGIPPLESAQGILKLVETFEPAETRNGVHSYDGKVYPW